MLYPKRFYFLSFNPAFNIHNIFAALNKETEAQNIYLEPALTVYDIDTTYMWCVKAKVIIMNITSESPGRSSILCTVYGEYMA